MFYHFYNDGQDIQYTGTKSKPAPTRPRKARR